MLHPGKEPRESSPGGADYMALHLDLALHLSYRKFEVFTVKLTCI